LRESCWTCSTRSSGWHYLLWEGSGSGFSETVSPL
jgi:hypothetical protein